MKSLLRRASCVWHALEAAKVHASASGNRIRQPRRPLFSNMVQLPTRSPTRVQGRDSDRRCQNASLRLVGCVTLSRLTFEDATWQR